MDKELLSRLYSSRRLGSSRAETSSRSGFQRDYDRLIFSSPFRRLQNKTQVFPLPGTSFVHNRLTHSLEVASVGRSLGKIVGEIISEQFRGNNEDAFEFYRYELANVIGAGCLAHDIGNPAFGHSGEKAISTYFFERADEIIHGTKLQEYFDSPQWSDLINFEGNANAIRILTHSFRGRFEGGFGLTYTTIASILKYPCESIAVDKNFRHRKKYGFFQSEKETVRSVAHEVRMQLETELPLVFKRHPFVYLVEAADDICYNIVDMEDAHRLGILDTTTVCEAFINVIRQLGDESQSQRALARYQQLEDKNEALAFLRARVINIMVNAASEVFINALPEILQGNYQHSLIGSLESRASSLQFITELSIEKIYNHDTVLQVEIAGYNVMSELLQLLVPALLSRKPTHKESKILRLFPLQFREFESTEVPYTRVQNALDLLSGMTDEYATELYRNIKGISIPGHGL